MVTENALYITYNVLSYMDLFLISTFEWFKTHPKLYVFASSLEDRPLGRSLNLEYCCYHYVKLHCFICNDIHFLTNCMVELPLSMNNVCFFSLQISDLQNLVEAFDANFRCVTRVQNAILSALF